MRIVNLTPHDLTLFSECKSGKDCNDGFKKLGTIEPDVGYEKLPRCKETIFEYKDGINVDDIGEIPLIKKEFSSIENLPPKEKGTRYFVSALARQCAPEDRDDLLIGGETVRIDRDGNYNTKSGRIAGILKFAK